MVADASGNYADLADLLEGLVPRLESATRSVSEAERPELFRLLAVMYHTCSGALANLGEPEAAGSPLTVPLSPPSEPVIRC